MQISRNELSRTLESRESRSQYRGRLLLYVAFKVHVNICKSKPLVNLSKDELRAQKRTNSTIESRRATASDTIFPEDFNLANFDSFVASETREVADSKI